MQIVENLEGWMEYFSCLQAIPATPVRDIPDLLKRCYEEAFREKPPRTPPPIPPPREKKFPWFWVIVGLIGWRLVRGRWL